MKMYLLVVSLTSACLLAACSDPKQKEPVSAVAAVSTVDSAVTQLAPADTLGSISTEPAAATAVATARPASARSRWCEALAGLAPATQRFTVNTARDTVLRAAQGTLVHLPANSLVTASGAPATGKVTITLDEYASAEAILGGGLHTMSGSALLESGGMVRIRARGDGGDLRLRPGSSARIAFPATGNAPGMQLFRGVDKGDGIDWLAVESPAERAPALVPARYPGGIDALERFFTRNVLPTDGLELGKNTRYALRLLVAHNGTTGLIDIQPEAPEDLRRSVVRSLARLARWTPATRLGVPVADTCTHYLSFEWTIGVGDAEGDVAASDQQPVRKALTEREVLQATQYYVLRVTELGWINCDRFYNDPRPRVDLYVETRGKEQPLVQLLFRSQRSVMSGEAGGQGVWFRNVPRGESVTVMGLRTGSDGAQLAFADAVAGEGPLPELRYVKMNTADVKERVRAAVAYR
ncbi:MAG: hypothetical protein EOO16_13435 [Chitinophagaceae bacterium]|nr:MAG: hypothetical protein EOO16_13435 [Chitinophagaceae bacterium]